MLQEHQASSERIHETNRQSSQVDSFRQRRAVIRNKLKFIPFFFVELKIHVELNCHIRCALVLLTVPKCESPPICGTCPGSSTLQQSVIGKR